MIYRNVLITGGAGFIGSNLALALLEKGYKVTILDNLSKQIHGEEPSLSPLYLSIKDNVHFILGDIRDRDCLEAAMKGQDIIVHYAAETGTGQSMYDIEKYTSVNIGGTALLLDILTNNKTLSVKKVIVASSRSIYGEGKYINEDGVIVYPSGRSEEDMDNGDFEVRCPITKGKVKLLPTDEGAKVHPSSVYGITKQNQEQMILTVGKALQIPAVALRYQNVYGPGQSLSNPYTGILSIFSNLIKDGKAINVFEDGKESRDFVYISDVIDATIMAIENDKANFNVYNVGYGVPTDVTTVAETLKRKYNGNSEIKITGDYRLGDIRHNYADLSRINLDLGFVPKVDFETGITEFTNWVNGQQITESKFEESVKEMSTRGLYKTKI